MRFPLFGKSISHLAIKPVLLVVVGLFGMCPPLPLIFVQEAIGQQADVEKQHSRRPAIRESALNLAESLAAFEVEAGWHLTLLASEPQVIDPIDAAFDDAGRMWFIEMRDYPLVREGPPQGKICVLDKPAMDPDGTLRYTERIVFADGLVMPTGLAISDKGVVATVAGRLVRMLDIDGDLQCDSVEDLLVGFRESNEQLRANHPGLRPDGKWYIASGLRGGDIKLPDANETRSVGARDIRYDPATQQIDLLSGPSQFGMTFDAWGGRILCSNRNPAMLVLQEQADLAGNPLSGLLPSVVDLLPSGADSRVVPIVDAWTTSNLHAGQFTAACGVYARTKHVDSSGLTTQVFTCEPTGSLVARTDVCRFSDHAVDQWQVLDPPSEKQAEWLASRDPWFRPVNLTTGPDGSVIVVDMHRAVIEHPEWVPEELKHRTDERYGNNAGRIYRIANRNTPEWASTIMDLYARPLSVRTDDELERDLIYGNAWSRATVSRLLIERWLQGKPLVGWSKRLENMVWDTPEKTRVRYEARLLAADLAVTLNQNPRETCVRLLSRLAPTDIVALPLLDRVTFSEQAVPQVLRFCDEVAPVPVRVAALNALHRCKVDLKDSLVSLPRGKYELVALVGAAGERIDEVLRSLLAESASEFEFSVDQVAFRSEVASVLAAKLAGRISTSVQAQRPSDANITTVQDIFRRAIRMVEQAGPEPNLVAASVLRALLQANIPNATGRDQLSPEHWAKLRQWSTGATQANVRQIAMQTLAFSGAIEDIDHLASLARSGIGGTDECAAWNAWRLQGDERFAGSAIKRLETASSDVRQCLIELLAKDRVWAEHLVDRLAKQHISPRLLGTDVMRRLSQSVGPDSQEVLHSLIDELVNTDRRVVLSRYKPCLDLPSNPSRGKQLFAQYCGACHRLDSVGVAIGPDISDSRTKTPLELLTAILDPNLAIDNRYFRTAILTEDGGVVEGLVEQESSETLTIRTMAGARQVVLRSDVAELRQTGLSLMPEGFEAQMDLQAMADLIGYVKNWRYLDSGVSARINTQP